MESQFYPSARQMFAAGQLDWLEDSWRALLLPISYVPDFTDQYLSDIVASVRGATSDEVTNPEVDGYVHSGDHIRFPFMIDNRYISQAVIFKDTTVESTSPLVAYIGDEGLTNEPFKGLGLTYYIYPNVSQQGFFRVGLRDDYDGSGFGNVDFAGSELDLTVFDLFIGGKLSLKEKVCAVKPAPRPKKCRPENIVPVCDRVKP